MKTKQKNAQGVVLMTGASRIWKFGKIKFAQGILVWRGPAATFFFLDFSQQVWTFRRDLLPQLLNPYHTIHAVTALQVQAAGQHEVTCPIFCVLRDEHLLIDLSIHFSPGLLGDAAAGFVWYTAAILLAATS